MATKKALSEKKKFKSSKVLVQEVAKGPWKKEEDRLLQKLVAKYGAKDWSSIAAQMASVGVVRKGKQCRERWFNHLSPDVRKDAWTPKEDEIIIKAHLELGNKWTKISRMLDGRPANAIKNHWNATLRRRFDVVKRQTLRDDEDGDMTGRKKRRREENYDESDFDSSSSPEPVKRKRGDSYASIATIENSSDSVGSEPGSPTISPRSPEETIINYYHQYQDETHVYLAEDMDSPPCSPHVNSLLSLLPSQFNEILLDNEGSQTMDYEDQFINPVIPNCMEYEDSIPFNHYGYPENSQWNYDSSLYDLHDDVNWQGYYSFHVPFDGNRSTEKLY